jgi:hypothetical protein
VQIVAKIFLISCVVFGALAGHTEDAKKQGLSLDALSDPLIPPDSSLNLAPDRPTPGVTGPPTGYPPIHATSGMQTPFLGLTVKMPLGSQK